MSAKPRGSVAIGRARRCTAGLIAAALLPGAAAQAGSDWNGEVLRAVNQARAQQGLAELSAAPELMRLAQGHSDRMAAERRLSHDGFEQRLDQTGRSLCVENVAGGTTRAAALVAAWTRAPAHRANLFEPRVRAAAVAVAGSYVTFFACD